MPYAFDPRRWDRRDQLGMVLGILVAAVAGGVLGYFWIPSAQSPGFIVRHSVLVFAIAGAVLGWIVSYLQGFTSNDIPPDYH